MLAVMASIMDLRNGLSYLGKLDSGQIQSKRMKQRRGRCAEFALNEYLPAARDEAEVQKEEFATLVRSPQFYQRVEQRMKRNYRKQALAERWLEEALPKL